MPEEEIAVMRAQEEAWRVRLSNVRTTPRELRVYERYVFAAERFADMRTPTLLMVGGDSPPRELANAEGVARALPNARVAVLERQQHIAMHTDPEGFVATVVGFVLG
jgi:pimeloyl-ACP methyl ester carboxylesterase